jgi:hypothetical protein
MNPSSGASADDTGADGGTGVDVGVDVGGAAFAIAHRAFSNSQLLPDLN